MSLNNSAGFAQRTNTATSVSAKKGAKLFALQTSLVILLAFFIAYADYAISELCNDYFPQKYVCINC